MGARQRRRELSELEKCLRDLQDDSSDISVINRELSELGEDFRRALDCEKTNRIVELIEDLNEPYQYSDGDLSAAAGSLNREISAVKREIEAEEEAERVAREAGRWLGSW